jgi:hypothetical protein
MVMPPLSDVGFPVEANNVLKDQPNIFILRSEVFDWRSRRMRDTYPSLSDIGAHCPERYGRLHCSSCLSE